MKFYYTLFLGTLIFIAAACHSTKFSADKLPERQVVFGTGGGFTGETNAQILLENGQMFRKSSLFKGPPIELKSIKKRKAKSFFKATEELDLASFEFEHPGNIYQFLELHGDSASIVRVSWGDEKYPVNQKIKDLYIALGGLIKTGVKR
jgi:hypothetical protein